MCLLTLAVPCTRAFLDEAVSVKAKCQAEPATSSLLNLITVSFFPLLFVCLGDNHRKACDSL